MDDFSQRLIGVLQDAFPQSTITINLPTSADEKYWGTVDWAGFDSVEHMDRQLAITQALKARLSEEERRNISVIFGVTPEEVEITSG